MATPHHGRSVHRQTALSRGADKLPLIALTSGEPAGIGPDICCLLAAGEIRARLACLGDAGTFAARAAALGLPLAIEHIDSIENADAHRPGRLQLVPVPVAAPVEPGKPDPANAAAVLSMLDLAIDACVGSTADAVVTAPLQKSTIAAGGYQFVGHTEYFAERTGTAKVVMLLASQRLRVALVTTHLPLAQVPAAITHDAVVDCIRIVDADLKRRFGLAQPRILVLGLNPHAGEAGVLGTEEQTTIAPAIAALAADGLDVRGPASADSAFTPESLAQCDAVVAMYHDQGLPALKAQSFGEIVNVTLGLPIVRTSVDHGTALTLAGSGRASHASLAAAVDLAIELVGRE